MSSSLSDRAHSLVAHWGAPVANSWNSAGGVVSDFGQDSGSVVSSTVLSLAGTQIFTIGTSATAALISAIQTGLWSNPTVWSLGRLPGPTDTVIIGSPYRIVLNTSSTISRFALNSGATYDDSAFTLTVTGNVALNGTWTGSGKLSLTTSSDTISGTGTATGKSTLEIAGGNKIIASSANLTLKIVAILSDDTLNNSGILTLDTLRGASTTSVFNNLSGSTLTVNGLLLSTGTLNAGQCPNTVIYDGSVAQAIKPATYCSVVVSGSGAKTLNSGSMTISSGASLNLAVGPTLTFGSGSSVSTPGTGKIALEAGSKYINLSNSAPTLDVKCAISGSEGWRMVAAPDNVRVNSMFAAPFVTQGFSGSTYPALQPNLLWWDETSQGTSLQAWRQPSTSSDTVKLGRGYMYYVFNGAQKADLSGNYGDVLPQTMDALGAEQPLTSAFDFGVTATTRSASGSPDTTYIDTNFVDYGWNLVGNPSPSTIDWNAASGWTKTKMDGTIYVWDPADTTGGYKTWNGTTGNLGSGLIAPYQAFWVKANGSNPLLQCDNGVKSAGGAFLGKIVAGVESTTIVPADTVTMKVTHLAKPNSLVKEDSAKEQKSNATSVPVLTLTLSAAGLQSQAYLMFSQNGKLTYDPYDAFSLIPLSDNYLILYTVAGTGQPAMQIQDLPDSGFGEPSILPVSLGGSIGGQPLSATFTLRWSLAGKLPDGCNIALMDDASGKAYAMDVQGELTFPYNTPGDLSPSGVNVMGKTSGHSSLQRSLSIPYRPRVFTAPSSGLSKASSGSRFRIVISANNNVTGYLPTTPELAQNYPNPFNPTTNISFSLPSRNRVKIEIFNILGQKITTLNDEEFGAGSHVVRWNAIGASSGVYFCRMIVGDTKQTKKMLLIR